MKPVETQAARSRASTIRLFIRVIAMIAVGLALRGVVGPEPVWWLAWIAPALLLFLGVGARPSDARWSVLGAALIGASTNFHYFNVVTQSPLLALAMVAGVALLWVLAVGLAHRVVRTLRSPWALFGYPAAWAAIHTVMAILAPDGDWGLIGYSQGDVSVIVQVASLGGVAAVAFLVSLPAAVFATAISLRMAGGSHLGGWMAYLAAAAIGLGALGYGTFRLAQPVVGTQVVFGLMAVDEDIGPHATAAYIAPIRQRYLDGIGDLARAGADVVVLPEKIAVGGPEQIDSWRRSFAVAAEGQSVWVEAGLAITDPDGIRNMAYLFDPEGREAAAYQKHFMAPPERPQGYSIGLDYQVRTVAGHSYGLAICKDMHFARLARAYSQRGAAVMLVPAWDFGHIDEWMGARMTAMRGVEQGFAVVRSSKEGLLSVSDPRGRFLTEGRSSSGQGGRLLATLIVEPRLSTLYSRIGDVFGWLCLAIVAAVSAPWPRRSEY